MSFFVVDRVPNQQRVRGHETGKAIQRLAAQPLAFAGQTHLNFFWIDAQQAQQIGMVPTGIEHFATDATLFCLLLL